MKHMIAKITGGYTTSAKIVDGTLILSCPDAVSPVVWRMDLNHAQAAALEVREGIKGKKEDGYTLVLKSAKDDIQDIAPFATRAQAVAALMKASRAMEGAQGHFAGASAGGGEGRAVAGQPKGGGRWIAALAGVVLLLAVLGVLVQATPPGETFPTADSSSAMSASATGNAGTATGVPLSAEDFLRMRQ